MDRRFAVALSHYRAALDSGTLEERERMFAELGVAVASRNREESRRTAREINERWPDDPDLRRVVEAFPGMFLGFRPANERPGRRFRRH